MTFEYERSGSEPQDALEALQVEHLERLRKRYFKIFGEKDLDRHVRTLARLSVEQPVEVLLEPKQDGNFDCTVLAFDYPGEFSIITGVLASAGFDIHSGDVFTYQGVPRQKRVRRRILEEVREQEEIYERKRIIDHFTGIFESSLSFDVWAKELRETLVSVVRLLERGDESSVLEARKRVHERVIRRLTHFRGDGSAVLYPVEVEIDNTGESFTRIRVIAQDTPAFLYSLSNALSLHELSIEHVSIRTIHGRVEDVIDLVDLRGRPISDPEVLNRVRLSVLLTKQFTYFLDVAPDPFTAFCRFDHLLADMAAKNDKATWQERLRDPRFLQDLARLLGASDFLWEDFVRLQYETLLPMLGPYTEKGRLLEAREDPQERLGKALSDACFLEEQGKKLNDFKDREIFLLDLDHILNPRADFKSLSAGLTGLAEAVVSKAAALVYEDMIHRFGRPRTVGGLEARYAVLGLGKLGGAALGYASDLELLFIYSDSGKTDGERSIDNSDFFARLVRGVADLIHTKREGIFHLDLRLRPYGNAGPIACSLEGFCRYYGSGGQAHAYERMALVNMRAISGDPAFGKQLERLRDEIVYFSGDIHLQDLQGLREKQFSEKTRGGRLNAKFSPGGLVDLEYSVQMLQMTHGKDIPALRTPLIHEALSALSDAGVLSGRETGRLVTAYEFLRRLINSMRMLRGSAQDLFLPDRESLEYAHLARRMGYGGPAALDPEERLHLDLENCMAAVRVFVEHHFGRNSIPGPETGTVADLVLSDRTAPQLKKRVLEKAGFKNVARAYVNLKNLAGDGARRETFSKLALLAVEILSRKPDPDMALNNWERYILALISPQFHFNLLLSQPMRLEILLGIFSGSQFLSDTLVRNPGFLDWVVIPEILHRTRKSKHIEEELRRGAEVCSGHREWLNKLRRLRRREILRIGTRDICLGVSTQDVVAELSRLADAFVQVTLEQALQRHRVPKEVRDRFCILALGKLGGMELNYSSDIDLLGLWDDRDAPGGTGDKTIYARLMEEVRSDLSRHTEEGYAYRVDLRLRPFGRAGELVPSFSALVYYYREKASLWEVQAALKARPLAGNVRLGHALLEQMRALWIKQRPHESIVRSIDRMREAAIKTSSGFTPDVKNGAGGMRDVEFLVQGLQLIHAQSRPAVLEGNTLNALDLLCGAGVLSANSVAVLKEDYLFLRRVEHYLQIMEDQQIYAVPKDREQLRALSKRVLGVESDENQFMESLGACFSRVRDHYKKYLLGEKGETLKSKMD
ncbi:MAG: glutamate-ammonia-ligase adenylyltransferase [Deltaproteobacteria bacterium]|nr:glutamate-ammonia-ligase adenylyltransferase [Deltaproteobacteria bacterium]